MEIIIIILLILLNGLFAMSEIALISARPLEPDGTRQAGQQGGRQSPPAGSGPGQIPFHDSDRHHPDRHPDGVSIRAKRWAGRFGAMLASLGMRSARAVPVAQILIVIVVTYLTIVFGELVPKRIGMKSAERVAILVARPMQVLAKVTSPFVWLLSRSIELITRLLGIRDTESKSPRRRSSQIIQEGTEDGEVQIVEQRSTAAYSRSATARWVRS